MNKKAGSIVLILLCALSLSSLLFPSEGIACPIPVFQYALEHWEPDPYDIIVHHGENNFNEEQQAALDRLKAAERGEKKSNILVMIRKHSSETSPTASDSTENLPRLEVRYPIRSGIRGSLWTGELTLEAVEKLLDSPLRRQIASHLLNRKTAVWVLLESGDRRRDDEAMKTLEKELARLKSTLKVPDPTEEWGLDLGDIYTVIDFAIVRMSRHNPDEQMLLRMLTGIERDLKDHADKPMAFPVYGKGLMMYALVGEGINAWTLSDAGVFLTGPCSCQVKAGNPGTDILMTMDWDAHVKPLSRAGVLPGAASTGGFLDRMEEAREKLAE